MSTKPTACLCRYHRACFRAAICLVSLFLWFACAASAQEPLVGQAREAVIEANGRPVSEMRRGDRVVAVFASGLRVEFEDGVVVKTNRPSGNIIMAGDGTRYVAGENGKVRRIEPQPAEAPLAASAVESARVPEGRSEEAAQADTGAVAVESVVAAAPAEGEGEVFDDSGELSASMQVAPVKTIEGLLQSGKMDLQEAPPPPPKWAVAVRAGLMFVLRLGLTTLLLVIATRWVGLPYFLPDLLKTAILSIAVFEGVRAIGRIGGQWQWLLLLRADEVFAFIALGLGLFHFKVVRNGLTALRIAVATKVATYFLMIGFGLAITFGLAALY